MGSLKSLKTVSTDIQAYSIVQLPVESLEPLRNHPFKLYSGERYEDMVESIRRNGILQDLLVRKLENHEERYEIIAGHNRWNCGKAAGLKTVPCKILSGLSDDEAMTIAVITNYHQRGFDDLALSEQALVLSQEYKQLFAQGKRRDIEAALLSETGMTSSQIETKLRSAEKLGKDYGMSRAKIHRIMRINYLINEFKANVDASLLALDAANEISFLPAREQMMVYDCLSVLNMKLTKAKAKQLREINEDGGLDADSINTLLTSKPIKKTISITPHILSKYFDPCAPSEDIMSTIEAALAAYFEKNEVE